jgi:predicted regulator of Ras-like GTPase activity (Roadblock/LC7/MglB family)
MNGTNKKGSSGSFSTVEGGFRHTLQTLLEGCDGAVGAVVMGFDGIAVDSVSTDPSVDVQTVSMEFSFVLTQVRKAAEILEVGGLEEVSVRSEKLVFVIRVLSDEYFLGLAMKPEGNFGKGRFKMRMALPELRTQL